MLFRKFMILIFVCFSISLFSQTNDPILVTVGNSDVRVSEFKYIYEKNNGANADYSEKSIAEYLDLYTKFKLKVAKAKQLQLDTITELKQELAGYRKQLASSYLIDKEITESLLKELYLRVQSDVEFAHIFIPVPENASNVVKNDAKNSMREIKSKIVSGIRFEDAVKAYSQDKNSVEKAGNLGYFTAKLPNGFYDIESTIYNNKIGEVSEIIESKIGFHLVKVLNKRPARGLIEVAHILLSPEQKLLADSLYLKIKNGKDFEMAVFEYSVDKSTSRNMGKLPPFGINTYEKSFEDAAFSLSKDNDVAKPILTKSGWHIIKRLSRQAPDAYDLFVRKMKAQINSDQRFDIAKQKLIKDIKKSTGFIENKKELEMFASGLDDEFYSYKWNPVDNLPQSVLFSLGKDAQYSVVDFANYCKKNTKVRLKYDKSKPLNEIVDELYVDYVNESVMDFEERSLESKYPDFKSLMREYEEGILLFEATKIHVWDRANQDTIGLQNFYSIRKDNYKWNEKALIVQFTITNSDEKMQNKIYDYAKKNDLYKVLKKFNKKNKIVSVIESDYEKGSKELEGIEWKQDAISKLEFDKNKNSARFNKIVKISLPTNKSLSEARGYVVADYQDYLEKEWMITLNNEFEIKMNKEVLNSLKTKN